jgi:hypothetical protein
MAARQEFPAPEDRTPRRVSKAFSKRLVKHPEIARHTPLATRVVDPFSWSPLVGRFTAGMTKPVVLAARDQLLVGESVLDDVQRLLGRRGVDSRPLARLFDGVTLPHDGIEDVVVLEVTWGGGLHNPLSRNVFSATHHLRRSLQGQESKVSPNHVHVAAPVGWACPHGPPHPTPYEVLPTSRDRPSVPVTVIDSGYIWDDAWGPNPLEDLCSLKGPYPADVLTLDAGWQTGTQDALAFGRDQHPSVLDALAGHANFVAGVVAIGCPNPEITLWNFNSAFVDESREIPLEIALCRTLLKAREPTAEQPEPASLINVGFSFPADDDHVSMAWKSTFEALGPEVVVVAPAGNQASPHRRYPAALSDRYGDLYASVIGVASINYGSDRRSKFSNYGGWVTCSAMGSEVISTFIRAGNVRPEDGSHGRVVDFDAPWATWNGTSFAAPAVTAAIAKEMNGDGPRAAWERLKSPAKGQGPDQVAGLGYVFKTLGGNQSRP